MLSLKTTWWQCCRGGNVVAAAMLWPMFEIRLIFNWTRILILGSVWWNDCSGFCFVFKNSTFSSFIFHLFSYLWTYYLCVLQQKRWFLFWNYDIGDFGWLLCEFPCFMLLGSGLWNGSESSEIKRIQLYPDPDPKHWSLVYKTAFDHKIARRLNREI